MRTIRLAAVLMLAAACDVGAAELACDPEVLRQSWDLLRTASWGQSNYEHAAFIVRDDAGHHQFVLWPFSHDSLRAQFHGEMPEHVEAIVHTHPNSRPSPSADDVLLARRLQLPVYVLTRTAIAKTDGVATLFIWMGAWKS